MAVYIKGMEMPKDTKYIDVRLFAKGEAIIQTGEGPYYKKMDAIEIPEPHGRLIDADAVMRNNLFTERDRGFLFDAPTVI